MNKQILFFLTSPDVNLIESPLSFDKISEEVDYEELQDDEEPFPSD